MRNAGRDCLVEYAQRNCFITYHDLWAAIGLRLRADLGNPWRQMPNLLGAISEQSYEDHHVLLTALVIEDGPVQQPSEGFFRLAAAMRLLPERDAPPQGVPWRGMTPAQRGFWIAQVQAIYELFK